MVGPHMDDAGRLEVVADGLPLFGCSSARSRHNAGQCSAGRRLSQEKGCAAGWSGRRSSSPTTSPPSSPRCPGARSGGSLVKRDAKAFITQLARAGARSETQLMRRRVEQAWRLRSGSIIASAAALWSGIGAGLAG